MKPPQRILVRLPNWAGDVVMATPGLRALRARFPDAFVVLWVRRGLEGLVEGLPFADAVVPLGAVGRDPRRGWREVRRLRAAHPRRFDLGVCLPASFSSALLLRTARVRRVVGLAGGGRGALLHERVPLPLAWGRRRRVAREREVLHLLGALGCEAGDTRTCLATTARDEASADGLLARLAGTGPLVVLAPGASYGPAKRWPPAAFARVGDALAAEGARVVVCGGPSERALGRQLRACMRAPVLDLCGRTDAGTWKALLRRAALLVANDAGARHVAAAFGTPSIVLMGPTDPARTDCNLERVTLLSTDVACRPCGRRHCPIDHRCMRGIAPERVLAIARARLAAAAPAAARRTALAAYAGTHVSPRGPAPVGR